MLVAKIGAPLGDNSARGGGGGSAAADVIVGYLRDVLGIKHVADKQMTTNKSNHSTQKMILSMTSRVNIPTTIAVIVLSMFTQYHPRLPGM